MLLGSAVLVRYALHIADKLLCIDDGSKPVLVYETLQPTGVRTAIRGTS